METNGGMEFEANNRKEIYEWVEKTLREHKYHGQGKADKGLVGVMQQR